jgi:hypothetical protein
MAKKNPIAVMEERTEDQVDTTTEDTFVEGQVVETDPETDEVRAAREAAELKAANRALGKDVVPAQYREKYAAGNGTCGDFIATEISSLTKEGGVPSLNAIKTENGIPDTRWAGFNNGMQRMNLANTLRASFLRGEVIRIGGREYSLAAALIEFNEGNEPMDPTNDVDMAGFIKTIDVQDTERTRNAIRRAFGPNPEEAKAKKAAEKAEAKAKAEADKAEKKAAAEAVKMEAKAKAEADKAEKKAAADKAKAEAKAKADADKAAEKASETK